MTGSGPARPPRQLAAGDIVAAYSDELGDWTAAQITRLTDEDPFWRGGIVAVLDLDWSGPEPFAVEDLGPLKPLVLTHHAHHGALSHCHFEWLLPRSCKVIGRAGLLTSEKPRTYTLGWRVGQQLSQQRRWDQGQRGEDPRVQVLSGPEVELFARRSQAFPEVLHVTVEAIRSLDCATLPTMFPSAVSLSLKGDLGTLVNASALGRLPRLKALLITDLFGMTAKDSVRPEQLPSLDVLALHSIPTDYAAAMKRTWKAEVANGTDVTIRSGRKPEWVQENRDNPLRDWDGREHISSARYRTSVAQYRATRRAVIDTLARQSEGTASATLTELGREFGDAFNRIDGTRAPFIETEEREELLAALAAAVRAAESLHGRQFPHATDALVHGVDAVRQW